MSRVKAIWPGIRGFLAAFPKYFGLYLGIVGLFSFNCFILEESFQTVMFGTWGSFEAQEWRLVKREVATMEELRTWLQVVNNAGNWLNPFGWYAYQGYVDAEREYIDAAKAKLFAKAPQVFDGEVVTFTFVPQEEEPGDGYNSYRNGTITVLAKRIGQQVTGRVSVDGDRITIDARGGE